MSVQDYHVRHNGVWRSACQEQIHLYDQTTQDFVRVQKGSSVRVGNEWEFLSCCPCPNGYVYNQADDNCEKTFEIDDNTLVVFWYDGTSMSTQIIQDAKDTANAWAANKNIQNVVHIMDAITEEWLLWYIASFNVQRFPFFPDPNVVYTNGVVGAGVGFQGQSEINTLLNAARSGVGQINNTNIIIVMCIDESSGSGQGGGEYHGNTTSPSVFALSSLHLESQIAQLNSVYGTAIQAKTSAGLVYPVGPYEIPFTNSSAYPFRAHVAYTLFGELGSDEINTLGASDPNLISYLNDWSGIPWSYQNLSDFTLSSIMNRVDNSDFAGGVTSPFASDLDTLLSIAGAPLLPENTPCGTECVCPSGFFPSPGNNECIESGNSSNVIPCGATL